VRAVRTRTVPDNYFLINAAASSGSSGRALGDAGIEASLPPERPRPAYVAGDRPELSVSNARSLASCSSSDTSIQLSGTFSAIMA
jgi:hypothetical protein